MKKNDLKEYLAGIAGKPYNSLIEHNLQIQSDAEREANLQDTIKLLPPWFAPAMEPLIDEWNETGGYSEFWRTDCVVVFNLIAEHAKNLTVITGGVLDDDDLFNVFQVVTLNYSVMASQNKHLREFAGIRKGSSRVEDTNTDDSDPDEVDPLEDQLRKLVPYLTKMAISSYTTFCEQFPVLAGIEVNRWDFYFTIAGICANLMGLSQKVGPGERYDQLTGILQQEIAKWNPNAENAMSNCMMHMVNQLGVEAPDDLEDAFNGMSYSLGSWFLASSFGRPLSGVEAKHADIVGGFILTFVDD